MPRRSTPGGVVYHVMNRGNRREQIFFETADYAAFERVLIEGRMKIPIRLCAYCLMPNHWHLVLWPEQGDDTAVSRYLHWITLTHAKRWHSHRETAGTGHLYQGRFRAIPVHGRSYFLIVCRYVERNPVRAGLVEQQAGWRFSSCWRRVHLHPKRDLLATEWPFERPANWEESLLIRQSDDELESMRDAIRNGEPFGEE